MEMTSETELQSVYPRGSGSTPAAEATAAPLADEDDLSGNSVSLVYRPVLRLATLPIQLGKRVKITSFHVCGGLLAIGTSVGSIYLYTRPILPPMDNVSTIEAVDLPHRINSPAPSLLRVIALDALTASTATGHSSSRPQEIVTKVCLSQIFTDLIAVSVNSTIYIIDTRVSSLKEKEKLLYKITAHSSPITVLLWDVTGKRLLAGDKTGVISRTSIHMEKLFARHNTEIMVRADSAIVQAFTISPDGEMLLLSTMTRAALLDMSKPQQSRTLQFIGQTPRNGPFGVCLDPSISDEGEVVSSTTQSNAYTVSPSASNSTEEETQIGPGQFALCARPGKRLWRADLESVTVESTLKLTLSDPSNFLPYASLLPDTLPDSSLLASLSFNILLPFGHGLVSYCPQHPFLYFVDIENVSVTDWFRCFTSISDCVVDRDSVFILHDLSQVKDSEGTVSATEEVFTEISMVSSCSPYTYLGRLLKQSEYVIPSEKLAQIAIKYRIYDREMLTTLRGRLQSQKDGHIDSNLMDDFDSLIEEAERVERFYGDTKQSESLYAQLEVPVVVSPPSVPTVAPAPTTSTRSKLMAFSASNFLSKLDVPSFTDIKASAIKRSESPAGKSSGPILASLAALPSLFTSDTRTEKLDKNEHPLSSPLNSPVLSKPPKSAPSSPKLASSGTTSPADESLILNVPTVESPLPSSSPFSSFTLSNSLLNNPFAMPQPVSPLPVKGNDPLLNQSISHLSAPSVKLDMVSPSPMSGASQNDIDISRASSASSSTASPTSQLPSSITNQSFARATLLPAMAPFAEAVLSPSLDANGTTNTVSKQKRKRAPVLIQIGANNVASEQVPQKNVGKPKVRSLKDTAEPKSRDTQISKPSSTKHESKRKKKKREVSADNIPTPASEDAEVTTTDEILGIADAIPIPDKEVTPAIEHPLAPSAAAVDTAVSAEIATEDSSISGNESSSPIVEANFKDDTEPVVPASQKDSWLECEELFSVLYESPCAHDLRFWQQYEPFKPIFSIAQRVRFTHASILSGIRNYPLSISFRVKDLHAELEERLDDLSKMLFLPFSYPTADPDSGFQPTDLPTLLYDWRESFEKLVVEFYCLTRSTHDSKDDGLVSLAIRSLFDCLRENSKVSVDPNHLIFFTSLEPSVHLLLAELQTIIVFIFHVLILFHQYCLSASTRVVETKFDFSTDAIFNFLNIYSPFLELRAISIMACDYQLNEINALISALSDSRLPQNTSGTEESFEAISPSKRVKYFRTHPDIVHSKFASFLGSKNAISLFRYLPDLFHASPIKAVEVASMAYPIVSPWFVAHLLGIQFPSKKLTLSDVPTQSLESLSTIEPASVSARINYFAAYLEKIVKLSWMGPKQCHIAREYILYALRIDQPSRERQFFVDKETGRYLAAWNSHKFIWPHQTTLLSIISDPSRFLFDDNELSGYFSAVGFYAGLHILYLRSSNSDVHRAAIEIALYADDKLMVEKWLSKMLLASEISLDSRYESALFILGTWDKSCAALNSQFVTTGKLGTDTESLSAIIRDREIQLPMLLSIFLSSLGANLLISLLLTRDRFTDLLEKSSLPPSFFTSFLSHTAARYSLNSVSQSVLDAVDSYLWSDHLVTLSPQLRQIYHDEVTQQQNLMNSMARDSKQIRSNNTRPLTIQSHPLSPFVTLSKSGKARLSKLMETHTDEPSSSFLPSNSPDLLLLNNQDVEPSFSRHSQLPVYAEDISNGHWGMAISISTCIHCGLSLSPSGSETNSIQPIVFRCGHTFHAECVPELACAICWESRHRK